MQAIDWEMMPYFLAVARGGSLRAGADLLGANHGTVDRHIKSLEASYGVQLFQRTKIGLQLTAAGETLVPLAEDAEQVFLNARRRVEGLDRTETGTIRFSLSPMLAFTIIAPILARFFEKYPDIETEVRLTNVQESIPRAEIDVSLRVAFEVSDDVVARKLYPIALRTYASQQYIDSVVSKAGPGGTGLTWIGWDDLNSSPGWLSHSNFPRAAVKQAVAEGIMQVNLVRAGYGMTDLPVIFEEFFPDLIGLPGTSASPNRHLWILFHSDLRRTVRVRRFVDFLDAELMALRPRMQGELYRKIDGAVKSRFLMRVGWVIIVHVYFTRPTDRRIV